MYIFTINNGSITSSKSINIEAEREITLGFDFSNVEFADNDIFQLTLNGTYTSSNYSFTNAGYLKFINVPFDFIQQETNTVSMAITRNGNSILSDSIIVIASIAGKTDKSNELNWMQVNNSTDIISLEYEKNYDIQQVNLNSNNATVTINPCTGYTAESGKIPTFEMWIKTSTAKTTISISNNIEIVNADLFPNVFATGSIYCFTWRFVGSKQLLNYSYKFEE